MALDRIQEVAVFVSIRIKIFSLVVFTLALVASVVMLSSKRDVERAILNAEERNERNVLNLVQLNIEGRYTSWLRDKVEIVKQNKERLKKISSVIISGLEGFAALAASGRVSEAEAKQMALRWIAGLSFTKSDYCFIYGADNRALSYPDQAMIGQDLSEFKDIKGRVVVDAAREEAQKYGHSYITCLWRNLENDKLVKRYGFFVAFRPWDWVVGATADVGDVEKYVELQLKELIKILQLSMPKVRVAETGYVILFTGKKELIVNPREDRVDFNTAKNELTNKLLLDDIIELVNSKARQPLHFAFSEKDQDQVHFESYVDYFKALDWYIATVAPSSELRKPAKTLLERQGIIFGGILVFGLAMALMLASRIATPLIRLTAYAKELPTQDFTAPAPTSTALDELPVRLGDEVGNLAESFVFMEKSLRENIHHLMKATAAKQRVEGELQVAREIQLGLLPKIFPPFPEHTEIDLYAMLVSAKEVGGDLYDFFLIDDNHLCFTAGDVSDKGAPAALFMAITKTLIKVAADKNPDPADMMAMVNKIISRDNPNSMFCTLFIGVLDMRNGHVLFANGGHNPPVIFSRAHTVDFLKGLSGPMPGAMEDMEYKLLEFQLNPGESILIYTDGVTEAMDVNGELFSDEKLLEIAATVQDANAHEIIDAVMHAVRIHAHGAQQSDDITMLCLRYLGPRA